VSAAITLESDRLVPEYIRRFHPYIPCKPDEVLKKLYGCRQLHRLHNNENPLGPPRAAQEIIRRTEETRAALYPSGDSYFLRMALARRFSKAPDHFLVGNGSCEVISSVIKAFCEKGDNIVTADKTFAVYEWVAEFSGCEARLAPLREFAFDAQAMLAAIDPRTKVIFVCNPNNPTGTYWNREQMAAFLDRVAGRAVVVVDEAYCEFVENADFPDGMQLLEQYPNVLVFRTFSKMFGMAGLRVGYLAGPLELVDYVRRAYVVYSVNMLAQSAARAVVESGDEHIPATRELIAASRKLMLAAARQLKLPCQCGEGNFLMLRVPVNDALFCRRLMRRGFMVRSMTAFRFPNWIRVSLASLEVMEQFAGTLAEELRDCERTLR
jgi:histidinol-phosphate aminotransferase